MKADGKLVVLVSVLGGLAGIAALILLAYDKAEVSGVRLSYHNPTEQSEMARAGAMSSCVSDAAQILFNGRMRGLGEEEIDRRYDAAMAECNRSAPRIDPAQYKLHIAFANGDNPIENLVVRYAVTSGQSSFEGAIEQSYLAARDDYLAEDIAIPFAPHRGAVCIEYDSGFLRRSWLVFSGEPANLVGRMPGDYGDLRSWDAGDVYWGAGSCEGALRTAVERQG